MIRAVMLVVLLAGLAACAAMPPIDTARKRMAAFEIAYQEALAAVSRHLDEGRISAGGRARLAEAISTIELSRRAAYSALEAGDLDVFNNRMRLMQLALQTLRDVVAESSPPPAGASTCLEVRHG